MHVTIRQLKVFEAVAAKMSYTKAAEELHLTQPAVSMQVKQLENTVGLALFEVIGKKVFLTQAGKVFQVHARQILGHLELAAEEMNAIKGIDSGYIQIGITPTVHHFAAGLVADFRREHDQVQVGLEVFDSQTLVRRLQENAPDIVLMGQPPAGLELHVEPFMSNPLVVIASPSHPLAGAKKQISIKQFAQQRIILREPGSETRNAVDSMLRDRQREPASRMEMNSNEAIKQAVAADLGVGVISLHAIEPEATTGRLVQLDVQGFPVNRTWYVVHRTGKHLSATATAFIDFVVAKGQSYMPSERQTSDHMRTRLVEA